MPVQRSLDTYAHVLPHMQDEAVARIEAVLFGRGVTNNHLEERSVGSTPNNCIDKQLEHL